MFKSIKKPCHPGPFIRKHIIPPGMTVTEAASRLRVGRPALSNLLNGNSSLSSKMAIRVEKAFGADRQQLLDLQEEFDRREDKHIETSITVTPYVPEFLKIMAKQIHSWPDNNLTARSHLPVLLRRLVHSTGSNLIEVDFPGYDNAERKGYDGFTNSDSITPWIPQGRCYWEFGVTENVKRKAEADYHARIHSLPPSERRNSTYIFVTPRIWPGKKSWLESKLDVKDWKTIRAYDANNLEQWLETSVPALMWFANDLGMPVGGFDTLDNFWEEWSSATELRLSPALFAPSVKTWRSKINDWLNTKSDRPFLITADSKEEALAFLYCVFEDSTFNRKNTDLITIFKSADLLRKLSSSTVPFIPIVYSDDTESVLATLYRERHCIVIRPRNLIGGKPDITLDRLDHQNFLKALADIQVDRTRAELLARESGCSPTILRRRMARSPALKSPPWSKDPSIARSLIPMALIGVWHTASEADCEIISKLSEQSIKEVEENVTDLLVLDESPIWSRGKYRGVASKVDALFGVCTRVTAPTLEAFFECATTVLREYDPSVELPEEERWAAPTFGKTRKHSNELRASICETLVMLSKHGDHLFGDRIGISFKQRVGSLISSLLAPLTLEKLLIHESDLPLYAEAAPKEFLQIINEDLEKTQSVLLDLLQPTNFNILSSPPRIGLLWALECLAWKHLTDVSLILARLSMQPIDDNYSNKPIHSLEAIFRAWMPQTTGPLEERIRTLELILKRYSDVGRQICISQLNYCDHVATDSYRPRWRSDASGAGQPVETEEEVQIFRTKAFELLVNEQNHDVNLLYDLIQILHLLSPSQKENVWSLINQWAVSNSDDRDKANLAEIIRKFLLTRWGKNCDFDTKERARAARMKLRVNSPVLQHAWLFKSEWIELEIDGDEEDDTDVYYEKREAEVKRLRIKAMKEIWSCDGFKGIEKLILENNASPRLIGTYIANILETTLQRVRFVSESLLGNEEIEKHKEDLLKGFLSEIEVENLKSVLASVLTRTGTEETVMVFRCAPFRVATWRLLDEYGADVFSRYWKEIDPRIGRHTDEDLMEVIDRLLDANRPLVAFCAVQHDLARVDTTRLLRLLIEMAKGSNESVDEWNVFSHNISRSLKILETRTQISEEDLATLEFLYINQLDQHEYHISNLEQQIAKSPYFFFELVKLASPRQNKREDVVDEEYEENEFAWKAQRALERVEMIPGTQTDKTIYAEELYKWIVEVRQLCSEHGCAEIGDNMIGRLLSKSHSTDQDDWPCVAICEAMERVASQDLGLGFQIGFFNTRGVHICDVGGKQERDLAKVYRGKSNQVQYMYPYVSRVYEDLADHYDEQAKWYDNRSEVKSRTMFLT